MGSSPFIERIKNAIGVMAKGRSFHHTEGAEGAFELREAQSPYIAIFDPDNLDIDP